MVDDLVPAEGRVKHMGEGVPDAAVHACPFVLTGANKEQCLELTVIYMRNLQGCCGTQDGRDFEPCNFKWRKCVKCLSEGKGARSGDVMDVARGLCAECLGVAPKKALQMNPASAPAPVVTKASTAAVVAEVPPAHGNPYVEGIKTLTKRERQMVGAYVAYRTLKGIQWNSLQSKVSTICTKLGMPKNSGQFHRRLALESALKEYKAQAEEEK